MLPGRCLFDVCLISPHMYVYTFALIMCVLLKSKCHHQHHHYHHHQHVRFILYPGYFYKISLSLLKTCMYIYGPDAVFRPSPASDVYVRVLHHFPIFFLSYFVVYLAICLDLKLCILYHLPVTVYIMTMKKMKPSTDIH